MNTMSFWRLLKDKRVEIPLIQRDYAQGRSDKEMLRTRFVTRLLEALEQPDTRAVKLDFVFGCKDSIGRFLPLDGQQRMTTLWLLHWYIAWRCGQLEDGRDVLNRFAYQTRPSSSAFCHDLVANSFASVSMGVVPLIKCQRWYYDSYEMDPSIRGFLRTLKTIEELVENSKNFNESLPEKWKLLTDDVRCPVRFFVRDDLSPERADDLYIKMNSRGKHLSEFENFKADLFGLPDLENKDLDSSAQESRMFDSNVAALFDNAWTDVFWKHRNGQNEIDDIYFEFLKRFFLAEFITSQSAVNSIEAIKKCDSYSVLYNGGEYSGINPFRSVVTRAAIGRLKDFFSAYPKMVELCGSETTFDEVLIPYWHSYWQERKKDEVVKPDFTLIPRYNDHNDPKRDWHLTFQGHMLEGIPVFWSAFRFLEANVGKITADSAKSSVKDRFRQWMRFVWHVVDNSFYKSDEGMISVLRRLDVLAVHSWDIEAYLAGPENIVEEMRGSAIDRAFQMEVRKAKLRAAEKSGTNVSIEWAKMIELAEESGFLHGGIDWLLSAEEVKSYIKETGSTSGKDFKDQVDRLRLYFDDKGVKDDVAKPFIKAMIRGLDEFWSDGGFYRNPHICCTDANTWRKAILQNPVMIKAVRGVLSVSRAEDAKSVPFADKGQEELRESFLESGILEKKGIIGQGCEWWVCAIDGVMAFREKGKWGANTRRYFFDTDGVADVTCHRNGLLFGETSGITVSPNDCEGRLCVPEDHHNVHFSYCNKENGLTGSFVWKDYGRIELEGKESRSGFDYKPNMQQEEFASELKKLITG